MDRELADDPPAEVPVDVLHVPFLEDDPEAFAKMDAASEAAPDYATATRAVYLLFLEHFAPNVAAAITAVARAPEGGVVVHCMGGKDRTGLVAAFLLNLAGVSDEDVAADYAASEERLRPRYLDWLAEAKSDAERQRINRVAATPAAAMLAVLDELERRHGSVEAFLLGAGASAEDLALARARLRD
jgi:protein-tyrosine phosphatase